MTEPTSSDSSAARLKSFIERIERLEEEKAGIAADIKEVYAEAKGTGFDTKIMRQVIRLRKMDEADRREQEELLELYKSALGMLVGTALGDYALRRARPPSASPDDEDPVDPDDKVSASAPAGDPPAPPEIDEALAEKAALALKTVAEAKQMGRDAHAAGKPIHANPFLPRSKQRGAFDTGWCEADGSDGMALPGAAPKSPPAHGAQPPAA
jgi:uncharacterized protein (UPF0335 family)